MKTFLASTSPARLMLLRAAGIEPEVLAPDANEPELAAAEANRLGRDLSTAELVQFLAKAKASSVLVTLTEKAASGIVIGSDSAFELDGKSFGKPGSAAKAFIRMKEQVGKTGVLYSGLSVYLLDAGKAIGEEHRLSAAEVSIVSDLEDAEISDYVATGEPINVAGGFTIDSIGSAYIDRISGDPSTVTGMSIPELRRMVLSLGIAWPQLWHK